MRIIFVDPTFETAHLSATIASAEKKQCNQEMMEIEKDQPKIAMTFVAWFRVQRGTCNLQYLAARARLNGIMLHKRKEAITRNCDF